MAAARKTPAERDRINACIRLKRLASRDAKLDILEALLDGGNLDRAALELYGRSEYSRGFSAGVKDATDGD